jgi:hypothetical protein
MYNRQFLRLAQDEIEAQILAMPRNYTSFDYYTNFESNHRARYEEFVRIYTTRNHDRPHAIQIVNSQLMLTVNNCFRRLTHKVGTIQNPKGGNMSEWVRN